MNTARMLKISPKRVNYDSLSNWVIGINHRSCLYAYPTRRYYLHEYCNTLGVSYNAIKK